MRQTDAAWSSRFKAADAMGEWLGEMGWDYWATWTFEEQRSARSVRRAVEAHIDRIGASRAFWGIESGKVNGRLHAHGLLHFSRQMPPTAESIWRDWYGKHGRAHVAEYDEGQGASHYVSKYVTKDIADYDIVIEGAKNGHDYPANDEQDPAQKALWADSE